MRGAPTARRAASKYDALGRPDVVKNLEVRILLGLAVSALCLIDKRCRRISAAAAKNKGRPLGRPHHSYDPNPQSIFTLSTWTESPLTCPVTAT